MWTAASRGLTRPSRERRAKGRSPVSRTASSHLAGGFVEVDVHREIEPLGELPDALERLVPHRVGGVRGECRRHQ